MNQPLFGRPLRFCGRSCGRSATFGERDPDRHDLHRESPFGGSGGERIGGGDHLAQNGGYLLALKFSLLVMSAMKPSVLQSGMDLPVQNSRRSMRIIPVRRRDWEGRSRRRGWLPFQLFGVLLSDGRPLLVKVRILAQMGIRKHPEMGDYNRCAPLDPQRFSAASGRCPR